MASASAPTNHIAYNLLARAHSPDTAAQQFTERVKQKPLYLRPTSPSAADNRSRRRHERLRKKEYFLKHQRPQPLSAREKRSSGLYNLPKEECKYDIFKGLHALWVGYMQEILDLRVRGRTGVITPASHGAKLVSADFHGAEVEVVRSQCASRVGLKGIVVRDTKFTFVVVTKKDDVKTIPKEHTVFRFTVPLPQPTSTEATIQDGDNQQETKAAELKPLVFELHGSQFENRPADRANKKFKWRNIDYV
ncbi:Uncharacterized protein PECH_003805 [Penicillium ucsense]|uniref:Ribonuclease P protein subunit n=1 Tax=Penicillium ucsense TaxID=2839758 RepID=A0A8J8VWA7_9EURO|nr:Uncharacterized protein PECM_002230 [Penicillium ucsense]KAF7729070.1 Uncharacterized protein PECH_003805 [Penicillium ucsense]